MCFKSKKIDIETRTNLEQKSFFSPPNSPGYSYKKYNDQKIGEHITKINFLHNEYSSKLIHYYTWITESAYLFEKDSQNIIILHLINKSCLNPAQKHTLLFSQNYNTNLGKLYSFFYDLSTQLKCDIISYDYAGYGMSTGTFSEEVTIKNIDWVGEFISLQCISLKQVIPFGHSVGAVPSIHFAMTNKDVSGLVLISPYNSLMSKTNKNNKVKNHNALFMNCTEKILCPTLLIHGELDHCVSVDYTRELEQAIKNCDGWYPEEGDNSNIYDLYRKTFIEKMIEFFDKVEEENYMDKKGSFWLVNIKTSKKKEKNSVSSEMVEEENKKKIRVL